MCMAWRFHFPLRNYDFKSVVLATVLTVNTLLKTIDTFPPQFFKARNIIKNKHATRATVPRVFHYNAERVVISHN